MMTFDPSEEYSLCRDRYKCEVCEPTGYLCPSCVLDMWADLKELKELLKSGDASDGYHTHNELYEYRMLYNAHATKGWLKAGIPVVKSWRHSDGELCFGGGWFVVSAQLPTGQVTNHYEAKDWDLFQIPEIEFPPAYDGHSPADVAKRLRQDSKYGTYIINYLLKCEQPSEEIK